MNWGCSTTILISPNVSNTLQCTHDFPHINHGIPQCTAHTLYREVITPNRTGGDGMFSESCSYTAKAIELKLADVVHLVFVHV